MPHNSAVFFPRFVHCFENVTVISSCLIKSRNIIIYTVLVERAKGRMLLLLSNKVPGYRVIKWSSKRLQNWATNIQPSVHLGERAQVNFEPIAQRKTPRRCILHTHRSNRYPFTFTRQKLYTHYFDVIIFGHGFFLTVNSEQEKNSQKK